MLKTTLYTKEGKVKSEITLPDSIFASPINPHLMAQAVKVYLANQRMGTAKTKTRAEINRTKAKWFRQKGTGRARHGSRSAPIFVGGGISHGPQPRDYHLSLPAKMKSLALRSALSQKYKSGEIVVMEDYAPAKPHTKSAAQILKNLTLDHQRTAWILGSKSENLVKSARNLPNITLRNASQLSTYDVLCAQKLLLPESALASLVKRFTPTSAPVSSPSVSHSPATKKIKTSSAKSSTRIRTQATKSVKSTKAIKSK